MAGMTDGELHVRTARAEDEDALRALDAAAWDSTAVFPSVLATLDDRPPFFSGDHGPEAHLVAELDGAVVGYARLRRPSPLPENAHVVEVNGLAVHVAARRRGVARALLVATEEQARGQGAAKVVLRVLGTNVAARQLYEGAGYVVEGHFRAEFRIDGVDVDDYRLARFL
jgi:ribosomal protein S18 acetylase RimI-like enzyme